MHWKPYFERGTELFKQGKFSEALEQFNQVHTPDSCSFDSPNIHYRQALVNGGETLYILYDSRAAVYAALNKPKDALRDAKTTIGLAPQRWHGYARAARLFMKAHKFDSSLKMVDRALACLRSEDHTRREELSKLRQKIVETQQRSLENSKAMKNYISQMPIEIFSEILQIVLTDDYARIITLLHVCAFWRQVIWESPSFWHTLVLSGAKAEKKASLWLDRARRRIRELRVLDSYVPNSSIGSIGKPSFLDDIDWSYLRVCKIQSPDLLTHLNPSTMFSHLDELEINVGGSYDNASMLCLPELKSLSIMSAPLSFLTSRQPPTRLTSLYLKQCGIHGEQLMYNLLFSNPQLESLYLDTCFIGSGGSPVSTSNTLNFPNLKTLEVISTFGISFLFRSNFPALQKLRLESLTYTYIPAFLKAEFPLLIDVSLKKVTLPEDTLFNMLFSVPTLESFTLNGTYANKAIEFLATDEPSGLPCLCPRLRYLDISDCPDMQTSTLHTLVKQRLHLSTIEGGTYDEGGGESPSPSMPVIVNKLEVLKMNGCPEIDSKWLPWFREHVTEVSCVYNSSRVRGQRSSARRM